jgi:hypothetical protein
MALYEIGDFNAQVFDKQSLLPKADFTENYDPFRVMIENYALSYYK